MDVGQRDVALLAVGVDAPARSWGPGPSNDLMAAEVCERALSSSIWPSSVSEMMTAAASKYTATRPMAWN